MLTKKIQAARKFPNPPFLAPPPFHLPLYNFEIIMVRP